MLLGRGLPPVYDRAALALSDAERAALEAEGRSPHWRFKLDHDAPIEWDDLIRGPAAFRSGDCCRDPVIRRADGSWLYMLPSVIDDIDMGVTHVVRGEDHVSNTALQLQMFAALGAAPPRFAHEALLIGSEGKLSKRLGSLGVDAFPRGRGSSPMALRRAARAARHQRSGRAGRRSRAADRRASISRASAARRRASTRPSWRRSTRGSSTSSITTRWPIGCPRAWTRRHGRRSGPISTTVAEAADWWAVVEGPIDARGRSARTATYLAEAARTAGGDRLGGDPWHALTAALKEATGRKGKALFLPLRRALTGRDHGPDMAALLPLIGRDRAIDGFAAA